MPGPWLHHLERKDAATAPDDAYCLSETEMYRCLAILFVVQLLLGTHRMCASATRPGANPDTAFDSVEAERGGQELALEQSDRRFIPFAGKRVGKIRIRTLAVFGASVDDTSRVTTSRLLRFLNNLNFETRESTIRRNLLFKEGDAIDPVRLADSERILRNLPWIADALIIVLDDQASDDPAELVIIVKESWSLMLSGSLKEGNRLKVSLTERNVLGLGHRVSGALTLTPDAGSRVDTKYSAQNIRGSFVDADMAYFTMPDEREVGLTLTRDLVSPVLRYAGGVGVSGNSIRAADSLSSTADSESRLVDLWAGRRFLLWRNQTGIDLHRILFASARVRRVHFNKRPSVMAPALYRYYDTNHVLGSLALIQSRYYRTSLLYEYGRTEDIPYGFLARVTYGLAVEEEVRNHYGAATLAGGEKIRGFGYGGGELRIGGYPKSGRLERGAIRFRTLYISNLLSAGGFRFRQFMNAEYIAGIRRAAGSSISFMGDEGVRGVVYDGSVSASRRLKLNFESVVFSPWRMRGLTVALFTFADLDFLGSGRKSLLTQDCYSGLGAGLRLRKDSYGIGSVQLRFAWYPNLPVEHDAHSFTSFGERRLRAIELLSGTPEIVEY